MEASESIQFSKNYLGKYNLRSSTSNVKSIHQCSACKASPKKRKSSFSNSPLPPKILKIESEEKNTHKNRKCIGKSKINFVNSCRNSKKSLKNSLSTTRKKTKLLDSITLGSTNKQDLNTIHGLDEIKKTGKGKVCKSLRKVEGDFSLEMCKVNQRTDNKATTKLDVCEKNDMEISGNESSKSFSLNNSENHLPNASVLLVDSKEAKNKNPELPTAEPDIDMLENLKLSFVDASFHQQLISPPSRNFQNGLHNNCNTICNTLFDIIDKISHENDTKGKVINSIIPRKEISVPGLSLIDSSVKVRSNKTNKVKDNEELHEFATILKAGFHDTFEGSTNAECYELNSLSNDCNISLTDQTMSTDNGTLQVLGECNSEMDDLVKLPKPHSQEIEDIAHAKINLNDLLICLSENHIDCVIIDKKRKNNDKVYMCSKCEDLFDLKFSNFHKNCVTKKSSVLINEISFICLVCFNIFKNMVVLLMHKKECLSKNKSTPISTDISLLNHKSNIMCQNNQDETALTRDPQSIFSASSCPQYRKINTEKRALEFNHSSKVPIMESENGNISNNLLSKVLSPYPQDNQCLKSIIPLEISQSILKTEKEPFEISQKEAFSSASNGICANCKNSEFVSVPDTCRKSGKKLLYEAPGVMPAEEIKNPRYLNNIFFRLNVPCSCYSYLYSLVYPKNVDFDNLAPLSLSKFSNFQIDSLEKSTRKDDNGEVFSTDLQNLPCIEAVIPDYKDFYKTNADPIENSIKKLATPANHGTEYNNQYIDGSIENSVVPDNSLNVLEQLHNTSATYHNEPSVSIQDSKGEDKIIIDETKTSNFTCELVSDAINQWTVLPAYHNMNSYVSSIVVPQNSSSVPIETGNVSLVHHNQSSVSVLDEESVVDELPFQSNPINQRTVQHTDHNIITVWQPVVPQDSSSSPIYLENASLSPHNNPSVSIQDSDDDEEIVVDDLNEISNMTDSKKPKSDIKNAIKHANRNISSSALQPVVPQDSSSVPINMGNASLVHRNKPSVSLHDIKVKAKPVKIPSCITLENNFLLSATDLYVKNSNADHVTYICRICFSSLMYEQIAKHFYEVHHILKDKFTVTDLS